MLRHGGFGQPFPVPVASMEGQRGGGPDVALGGPSDEQARLGVISCVRQAGGHCGGVGLPVGVRGEIRHGGLAGERQIADDGASGKFGQAVQDVRRLLAAVGFHDGPAHRLQLRGHPVLPFPPWAGRLRIVLQRRPPALVGRDRLSGGRHLQIVVRALAGLFPVLPAVRTSRRLMVPAVPVPSHDGLLFPKAAYAPRNRKSSDSAGNAGGWAYADPYALSVFAGRSASMPTGSRAKAGFQWLPYAAVCTVCTSLKRKKAEKTPTPKIGRAHV